MHSRRTELLLVEGLLFFLTREAELAALGLSSSEMHITFGKFTVASDLIFLIFLFLTAGGGVEEGEDTGADWRFVFLSSTDDPNPGSSAMPSATRTSIHSQNKSYELTYLGKNSNHLGACI
jgi:hypothetical protein